MPTLNDVRVRVDAWLAARWPTIVTRQETYFATHGKYWQGLATHSIAPSHTTAAYLDLLADRLLITPSDQTGANWVQALSGLSLDIELFPAALVMDAYAGPLGHGFIGAVIVRFNGTLYTRQQNYGPETWQTKAWGILN